MDYTVVLLRPEYLCEEDGEAYGQDIYVAHVEADTVKDGISKAQDEVFHADRREGFDVNHHLDYEVCVVFKGHIEPVLYGWQL